jgi:chromosomal replication initiation ATPase DnaA
MRETVIRNLMLSPEAEAIADFEPMDRMHADARRGSSKLLLAIIRARRPKPIRRTRVAKYGTFDDRQLAIAQIERLQRAVADHYGIPVGLMTDWRGPRPTVRKRQVAMYLAREVLQVSYPVIARGFHHKDHTTVMHACRVVGCDPDLATDLDALRQVVRA